MIDWFDRVLERSNDCWETYAARRRFGVAFGALSVASLTYSSINVFELRGGAWDTVEAAAAGASAALGAFLILDFALELWKSR